MGQESSIIIPYNNNQYAVYWESKNSAYSHSTTCKTDMAPSIRTRISEVKQFNSKYINIVILCGKNSEFNEYIMMEWI